MAHIANIDQLKSSIDLHALAQIISPYTQLKKGGGRLKGRCPFHDERTPSFSVGPGAQFYCFGCGVGGDAFKFLMQIEGLSFPEAVERAARLTGFTLEYEERSAKEKAQASVRMRIAAANAEAAELYRKLLVSDVRGAAKAREYLSGRGFTDATLELFAVGWAPAASDTLRQHLHGKGYTDEFLVDAGLLRRNKRGGVYDAFRDRVMFPITDATATRMIGFAGRVIANPDDDPFGDPPPKYVNTTETELYVKTEVLYAFGSARKAINRADEAIVVEGYTDVMGLHQAGVFNAVASCGTAIGVGHMRALGRVANRVVVMADGDEAGRKAATRAWEAGEEAGVRVEVAVLPDGIDPADLAAKGPNAIRKVLDARADAFAYVLGKLVADAGDTDGRGRAQLLRDAIELLGKVADPLDRTALVDDVAAATGFDRQAVIASCADARLELRTATASASSRPPAPSVVASTRRRRIEAQVLWIAMTRPELLPHTWERVTVEDFSVEASKGCFTAIQTAGAGASMSEVAAAAADDGIREVLGKVAMGDPPEALSEATAATLVEALVAPRAMREAEEVKQRLASLDDDAAIDAMLAEQQRLLTGRG